MRRLNTYYLARELKAIAKAQDLDARLRSAAAAAAAASERHGDGNCCSSPAGGLSALAAAAMDFHWELVLLRHWSRLKAGAVAAVLTRLDEATGRQFGPALMSAFIEQQVGLLLRKNIQITVASYLDGVPPPPAYRNPFPV